MGGTFTQHTKNGDVYTGIQIRWKEEKSGIHTFTAKIKQSDGTVAAVIETEFQYKGVAEEIYSNKFHTIKIIPKGKE